MTDIDRIAAAVARHLAPPIPIDRDLWSTKEIAAYLKRDRQVVNERIVCLETFPRPIRLPIGAKRGAHRLWKAVEVMAWAESHQDKPERQDYDKQS